MREFQSLLQILQRELKQQEKLLELLGRESAAIAKLNQEQIEGLAGEKEKLLNQVRGTEDERKKVAGRLNTKGEKAVAEKLSALLETCPPGQLREQLRSTGAELKKAAEAVRALNTRNGSMLKLSLGMVSSMLAIMRSAPGTELPTYGEQGKLKGEEDPAFVVGRKNLSREA